MVLVLTQNISIDKIKRQRLETKLHREGENDITLPDSDSSEGEESDSYHSDPLGGISEEDNESGSDDVF